MMLSVHSGSPPRNTRPDFTKRATIRRRANAARAHVAESHISPEKHVRPHGRRVDLPRIVHSVDGHRGVGSYSRQSLTSAVLRRCPSKLRRWSISARSFGAMFRRLG